MCIFLLFGDLSAHTKEQQLARYEMRAIQNHDKPCLRQLLQHASIHPSLSIWISIRLSIYLCIYLSVQLPVYRSLLLYGVKRSYLHPHASESNFAELLTEHFAWTLKARSTPHCNERPRRVLVTAGRRTRALRHLRQLALI